MKKVSFTLFTILLSVMLAGSAWAATINVSNFGQYGWYSDDTRDASNTDLVGTYFTQYGKPGKIPSAVEDAAIASQLQFVAGPSGGLYGGSVKIDGTTSNSGKSTISTVNLAGFAPASDLVGGFFTATYKWYMEPNPTQRTVAFRIGIQSSQWAASQASFTAVRGGEQTWDLILVNVMASPSANAWNDVTVDMNNGLWYIYGQATNPNWIGIAGAAPPAGTLQKTLAQWQADATWGPILFGAGSKITNIQFGLGSSQRQCNAYVDYLQTTLLNGGDVINFSQPVHNLTQNTYYSGIQLAVNAAIIGDIIEVSPGTYYENVLINKDNLVLRSTNGSGVTTIIGSYAAGNGTVMIASGTNGVTVGQSGKGFKLIGFDGNGAIETACLYLLGAHNNITVEGNELVANGEHGLLANWNASINNIIINDNIFSGKTFVGSEPGDCGFANQFNVGNNVPRQLVTLGGGAGVTNSMNVTFTNNNIIGTTGGYNSTGACYQGNTLVTIDVIGALIQKNTFKGTTTAYANSLRTRGHATSISCNTFETDYLGSNCLHIYFGSANPFDGTANPNTLAGVAAGNSFPDGGAYLSPNHASSWVIFQNMAQASAAATLIGAGQTAYAATTSLNCPVTNLNTAKVFPTIQSAINDATTLNGHTIMASAGVYNENVTLNKSLTLLGAQQGINACGRSTTESQITGTGTLLMFVTGSAGSVINGFEFSGGNITIQSTTGPIDFIQILNNRIVGFTGSGIFLNDNGIDITIHQNYIDGASKTGSGDLLHLDTDNFNGFYLTNNCIQNGPTANGFFVDGTRNVGPSTNRQPKIEYNQFSYNSVGANIGRKAILNGSIKGNNFTNNIYDGLQGGPKNCLIIGNTFSGNGRSGLALTGFSSSTSTDSDRGAINNKLNQNLFFSNTVRDVFFNAFQYPGTISSNTFNYNSLLSPNAASYTGTETINAEYNWWGDCDGPCPPINQPTCTGLGGTVTNGIDYTPWLGGSLFSLSSYLHLDSYYFFMKGHSSGTPEQYWSNNWCPDDNLAVSPDPYRYPVYTISSPPMVEFGTNLTAQGHNWGASDVMQINYDANITSGVADIMTPTAVDKTLFVVFKPEADANNGRQVIFEAGETTSGFNIYTDNDNVCFGMWNRLERMFLHTSMPSLTMGQYYLAQLEYNATKKEFRAVVNGSIQSPVLPFSGLTKDPDDGSGQPSVGIAGEVLGTRFHDYNIHTNNYSHTYNGGIGDVILFNSHLDATKLGEVYAYFNSKYGTSWTAPAEYTKRGDWKVFSDVESNTTLSEAWPNPFTNKTSFSVMLPEKQHVRIELINSYGELIQVLYEGVMDGGIVQDVTIDGANLPSGLYVYRVMANGFNQSGKVILTK